MAEYIELEPLRDEILNDDFDCDIVNHFLGIVDSQPTADVVEVVECREICHKALEKQIPKKPNKKGYPFDSDIDPLIYGYCPCCNAHMNSSKAYCDKCGQAVDWSDTE